MTEEISNNNSPFPPVREIIRKFNRNGKPNGFLSQPIKSKDCTHLSSSTSSASRSTMSENNLSQKILTPTIQKWPPISPKSNLNNENGESISVPTYASPTVIYKELQLPTTDNTDDIGLEANEFKKHQKQTINNDRSRESVQYSLSTTIAFEENDIQKRRDLRPPPPPPLPSFLTLPHLQEELNSPRKRSLPLSNFLLEIGALLVVFIVCMVLVLAIREDQTNLQTVIQIVYAYIYLISIIWMIWCTYNIIKFRRKWIKLTSSAQDQEEYMDIVERYPHNISYFPDRYNNDGLFMRVGAGLLCMGSLLLTVIELAKTIEMMRTNSKYDETHLINYSQSIFAAKSITFILRFLFHCVQFTFIFRYGNIIINQYHFIAKIGLMHIIIANFCTWFQAIVFETLEELHKNPGSTLSTNGPMTFNTTKTIITESVEMTTVSYISSNMINILKDHPSEDSSSNNTTTSVLEFIEKIQLSMVVYLYPCLIEYSLISITVFYIMWRNVGKTENRTFLHFSDRHIFTVNCSRASCGLLIGGVIVLLTILTIILYYILDPLLTTPISHITELILLIVSLLIVFISFIYTTKLYYDRQSHVNIFDQILILVTTVGDFAYSFFGLFASILIESYPVNTPRSIEVSIGLLAIFQTFLQSAFILDALKRRTITKNEIRKKPGRELITALLLVNLAIWMHDSLSAKKVQLNPYQSQYYDRETWSIVQAFISPLSIFYRFHSSVCLVDIWQKVYIDHGGNNELHQSMMINNQR